MRVPILTILLVVFLSCDNNGHKVQPEADTASKQPASISDTGEKKPGKFNEDVTGCYMQVLKKDTMVLKLEQHGEQLTGRLTYDNYQKDGSSGSIRGRREGDIIKLVYSFESEGMKSVMEVYFKEKDGGFVRGIGEMQTKADTAYFVNPAEVQYPSTGIFEKVDCGKLLEKYQ